MSFKEVLLKNRKLLISTIHADGLLLENLYSAHVLNERQYQLLNAENIQLKGAEMLVDFIQNSGKKGFKSFCEALKDEYDWLSGKLKEDAQTIGLDVDTLQDNTKEENPILPLEFHTVVPSERQLMLFTKSLVRNDWHSVMYNLGLNTADIDHFRGSNPKITMQCMAALVHWLRKNGSLATFRDLFQACLDSEVDMNCLSELVEIVHI